MPLPLVERSEEEIAQIIKKKVEAIKDVKGYHQLSVRMTGKRFYIEMHILLDSNLRFEDTHKIASKIEREVKNVVPNARVTIHTEPLGGTRRSIWRLVKEIAEGVPGSRGVHNVHVQEINGKLCVDLHLEVSANMTVKQAHDVSDQVEKRIREVVPDISEIIIHVESAQKRISRELAGVETGLESYIEHVATRFPEIKRVHGIEVRKVGDALHVVLRCNFDPNINIRKAHEISNSLEREIRSAYPRIIRIDVHEEPA
ncbi:MAG: cation transporter dimerization domain-containing protein [Nitrososphaeria archaeon]